MSKIVPDTDQALEFLQWASPDQDWVLTSIHPDTGEIETRTLNPAQARVWIDSKQGVENLYWHVNTTMSRLKKKAEKKDIRAVRFFHVDLDYKTPDLAAERARLLSLVTDKRPQGVPEPTAIVFSGGGIQAYWKLITPIIIGGDVKKAEEAERYNRQLEALLGADPCHNVDRIMRIPGTINVPNKKKLARGRVPALSCVLELNGPCYETKAFRKADPVSKQDLASTVTDQIKRVDALDELDEWGVPDPVKVVIAQGKGLQDRDGDSSRSGWLIWAVMSLVKHKVPDEIILGLITDPGWKISECVLEKKNVLKYAQRQISRAKEKVKIDVPFRLDAKGNVLGDQQNIRTAMIKLGVDLSHDKFSDRLMVRGVEGHGPLLQDETVSHLWLLVEDRFDLKTSYDYFCKVIDDLARQSPYHPVRDYLDDLTWDGIPRIDTWLIRYGEAEDNAYTRAVGAIVLIAAVRRVREPGCKFDEMLILESTQGSQKSTALYELCPEQDWFTDDLPLNADSKVAMEQMSGRWIIEAADLKGLKRGDVDHIKSFLSRRVDRARMAYGRLTKDQPRQSIIIGTMNDAKYFRDTTGNRRFWPVSVGKFKIAALQEDRDQLWAEAAFREAQQESIRLHPSLWDLAGEQQDKRKIEDPYAEILERVLGNQMGWLPVEAAWKIIGVPEGQRTQNHGQRLHQAMTEMGWRRDQKVVNGTKETYFVRGYVTNIIEVRQIGTDWEVGHASGGDVF